MLQYASLFQVVFFLFFPPFVRNSRLAKATWIESKRLSRHLLLLLPYSFISHSRCATCTAEHLQHTDTHSTHPIIIILLYLLRPPTTQSAFHNWFYVLFFCFWRYVSDLCPASLLLFSFFALQFVFFVSFHSAQLSVEIHFFRQFNDRVLRSGNMLCHSTRIERRPRIRRRQYQIRVFGVHTYSSATIKLNSAQHIDMKSTCRK